MSVEWSTEVTVELAEAYRELRESHLAVLGVLDDTLQRNATLIDELKTRDLTPLPMPDKYDSGDRQFFTEGEKADKFGDVLESETGKLKAKVPAFVQRNVFLEAEVSRLEEALDISKKSCDYLKADRDAVRLELESLKKAKQILTKEFEAGQAKLESQLEEAHSKAKHFADQVASLQASYVSEVQKNGELHKRLEDTARLLEDERSKQQEGRTDNDSLTLIEQRQGLVLPSHDGLHRDHEYQNKWIEPLTMPVPQGNSEKDNILDDIVIVEDKKIDDIQMESFDTLGGGNFGKEISQPHFGGSPPNHHYGQEYNEEVTHYKERLEAEQRTVSLLLRKIKDLNATIEDMKRVMYLQTLETPTRSYPQSGQKTNSPAFQRNPQNNHILMELQIENNLAIDRKPQNIEPHYE